MRFLKRARVCAASPRQAAERTYGRRVGLWVVRLGVATIALVVAMTMVDAATWSVALRNPHWLVAAIAAWLVNQVGCALRFHVVARAMSVPLAFPTSFRMTVIGFFVGCTFGGFAANDVARAVLLRSSKAGTGLGHVLVVLLVDRILGFGGFVTCALLLSFMVEPVDIASAAIVGSARFAGYVVLATLFALAIIACRVTTPAPARHAPARYPRVAAMVDLVFKRRVAAGMLTAFPLSLAATGALVAAQGWAGGQASMALGLPAAALVQSFLAPASIVISVLPIVPLGVGVGQLTLSGLYALFGLPVSLAVVLTTLMQVAQLIVATCLGIPAMAAIKRSEASKT